MVDYTGLSLSFFLSLFLCTLSLFFVFLLSFFFVFVFVHLRSLLDSHLDIPPFDWLTICY